MAERDAFKVTGKPAKLLLGDVEVRPQRNEIAIDGATVRLQPKVMAVLLELARAGGDVVTKQQMLDLVWPNMSVSDNVLTEAIHQLRRALSDDPRRPRYIKTIPRRGYRLVTKVRQPGIAQAGEPVVKRPRIAVTSFRSLSNEFEDRFFCEGLCEELISSLGRYGAFDVLARTSTLEAPDNVDPSSLADQLGVTHLIAGTLRRDGNSIRVIAHLVDCENGTEVWSYTYDRDLEDLIRVQDEIARRIGEAIAPRLDHNQGTDPSSAYVPDPESFREFSKGRFFWKQDNANPQRAMEHYEKALQIDPHYAAPYAGLVECFNTLGVFQLAPQAQMREASLAHAEQALFLDPISAETLFAFGYSQFYMRWNWRVAEQAFRKCLTINPNHALAHSFLSLLFCALGRRTEAYTHAERATDLDPFSPFTWWMRALQMHYCRDLENCLHAAEQGFELHTDDVLLSWVAADALVRLGHRSRALELIHKLKSLTPEFPLFRACAALLYQMLGLSDEVIRICEETQDSSDEGARPFVRSMLALAVGQLDSAVGYLEASERARDATLWIVACEPYFDPLRDNSRFLALLRRLNLAEPGQ